jgi:23S rRNA (uracil1939-C5)-methyltransferase
MKNEQSVTLEIKSLNDKGYGVGFINSREVWCLNALIGETVKAKIFKSKNSIWYGEATEIIKPSKNRMEPKDEAFLATSPYQILEFGEENRLKNNYIQELFITNNIPYNSTIFSDQNEWNYRNKMEFSFYGDENGLSLAFYKRGSHSGKYKLDSSSIASKNINIAAKKILEYLNSKRIDARHLKTLIIRSNQHDQAFARLYIKDENLQNLINDCEILVGNNLVSFSAYYSDPKSPASLNTKKLFEFGESVLTDFVNDLAFNYSIDGFFQVNIPVFEKVITDILDYLTPIENIKYQKVLDLYAGVGVIGLCLLNLFDDIEAVEIFEGSKEFALSNFEKNYQDLLASKKFKFTQGSSEEAVESIMGKDIVILDPPRAGLDPKCIEGLTVYLPKTIIYLSCNPKTQVEDISKFIEYYNIKFNCAYNFYPKTPHVENLVILERK